jgi:hypothetical protein
LRNSKADALAIADERTADLVRLLSHYMKYIGQYTELLSGDWDEKLNACLTPPQRKIQPRSTLETTGTNLARDQHTQVLAKETSSAMVNTVCFPTDVRAKFPFQILPSLNLSNLGTKRLSLCVGRHIKCTPIGDTRRSK